MADMWSPEQRGIAIVGYAVTLVAGPTTAPIIGNAVTYSYLGWRWTMYLTGIVMMAQCVFNVLLIKESHPPTLLGHKARQLRFQGKNWALHAKVCASYNVRHGVC